MSATDATATPSAGDHAAQVAFQSTIAEFRDKLKDDELYAEILKTTSIDQVYDFTDKLQKEQSQKGHLRHLSKIAPFLERLREYTAAVDTFVQVKPDILGLIWGPIKLLLQWTSTLKTSFDAIINTTAQIGIVLPEFKEATEMFNSTCLHEVLALFFQDVIDFYVVALKFFKSTRWRLLFESLWPHQQDRIKVVVSNIERHSTLMRSQVQREHVREEYAARLRALEHFEKQAEAEVRASFSAMKVDASPIMYDDVLNRIDGRLCAGTGSWLIQDAVFSRWVDANDRSARRVWLRGIPGAGKTYLATTVIRHVMKKGKGKVVFAYLSHTLSSRLTALAILTSFIFQLAQDDFDLQLSLCQLSRENLKNDLTLAVDLLKSLLQCAGHTYIIIDGLDEIDSIDRRRLLDQLSEISKICEDSKLLISSRPVDDITSHLTRVNPSDSTTTIFETIRVETRNESSIQTFVNRRKIEWFDEREFFDEFKAGLEDLLIPFASKAKGMFLYADLVFKTIWDLEPDDITEELTVPPEDLNEAYARILGRISKLKPKESEKARHVLGWIGCSPYPLTIYEVEQALCITGPASSSEVKSKLNIVRLCGPIVEVVDEYLQFVHFTVKEYLFSPQVQEHLDLQDAQVELATRCAWYLCQAHHDEDTLEDSEDLDRRILKGQYRLHYYASHAWPALVQIALADRTKETYSPKLIESLKLLYERRSDHSVSDSQAPARSLASLESSHPQIYAMIAKASHYATKCANLHHHITKSEFCRNSQHVVLTNSLKIEWVTRQLYTRIARLFREENILILKRHYGLLPFKCGFIGCANRRGFDSTTLRQKHERLHETPWKCNEPACEYSRKGFLSRRMRNDHRCTHVEAQMLRFLNTEVSEIDLERLYFDLITADDVAVVKELIQQGAPGFSRWSLSKYGPPDDRDRMEWTDHVLSSGSPCMIQLFLPHPPTTLDNVCVLYVIGAIRGSKLPVLRWLLSRPPLVVLRGLSRSLVIHELLESVLASESDEIWQLSLPIFTGTIWISEGRHDFWDLESLVELTSGNTLRENMLMNFFDLVHSSVQLSGQYVHQPDITGLGSFLGAVAGTTCSIPLCARLVKHGAHIDSKGTGLAVRTPLHKAVAVGSRKAGPQAAAELVKFLLYHGANPYPSTSRRKSQWREGGSKADDPPRIVRFAKDEPGCREIEKYLGMSWDALVQKVQEDLRNGVDFLSSSF